jgi:hypothetical protein
MDDVLGDVLLGRGDEPLDALDVPGPSACSTALVRPAPTSEPASGSVSTMVAPQPRSIMRCAIFFWMSLPLA